MLAGLAIRRLMEIKSKMAYSCAGNSSALRSHSSMGVLCTEYVMMEVGDPLTSRHCHIQIFYAFVEMHLNAAPEKRREFIDNIGRRRISQVSAVVLTYEHVRTATIPVRFYLNGLFVCGIDIVAEFGLEDLDDIGPKSAEGVVYSTASRRVCRFLLWRETRGKPSPSSRRSGLGGRPTRPDRS
jgi:hypothetical protein